MDTEEEVLDLVDSNNVKIGVIGRSKITSLKDDGGRYIRSANAFFRNSKGLYWTPRRNENKQIAPGGLDFAMAEHMGADETYLEAAIRGFQEELNLNVKASELRLIGILGPRPGVPYFGAYFLYKSDIFPSYSTDDYTGADWMTAQEIISKIENGEKAKPSLVPALKLLLLQEGAL